MKATSDAGAIRVFAMHGHLVFVTKDRRRVFTKAVLDDARIIFASVCANFGAEPIAINSEDDHVHCLVNHPPKVAISTLVSRQSGRVEPPAPEPPSPGPP